MLALQPALVNFLFLICANGCVVFDDAGAQAPPASPRPSGRRVSCERRGETPPWGTTYRQALPRRFPLLHPPLPARPTAHLFPPCPLPGQSLSWRPFSDVSPSRLLETSSESPTELWQLVLLVGGRRTRLAPCSVTPWGPWAQPRGPVRAAPALPKREAGAGLVPIDQLAPLVKCGYSALATAVCWRFARRRRSL